jgi:hypothetical protein
VWGVDAGVEFHRCGTLVVDGLQGGEGCLAPGPDASVGLAVENGLAARVVETFLFEMRRAPGRITNAAGWTTVSLARAAKKTRCRVDYGYACIHVDLFGNGAANLLVWHWVVKFSPLDCLGGRTIGKLIQRVKLEEMAAVEAVNGGNARSPWGPGLLLSRG